ncbi:hypothetical protein [Pseudarthrobacter humi]|uniref:hypothetical protein n=1 Tax=Pseudarthrobacter humi TaxID=2952523 RepID=UPI0020C89158|nr:hypothetical protein [Pseudarthrobacter humi]
MLAHPKANSIVWGLTGLLTLFVSVVGIWEPDIYTGIVAPAIIPGAYSQDLISAATAIILLCLSLARRSNQPKQQIIALGILGYLFYAYGIYVIERAYNGLYLVYMAIFTLSFWALISAGATFRKETRAAALPRTLRLASAAGALLQPLIFYPLWIAMLLPLMRTGEQIDSLYSIFILDLCFIMPAFLILSILAFRSHRMGLIFLPALYVLGFTVIFSLALGEIVKPLFGAVLSPSAFWPAVLLSMLFLVLGTLHLHRLTIATQDVPTQPDEPANDSKRVQP